MEMKYKTIGSKNQSDNIWLGAKFDPTDEDDKYFLGLCDNISHKIGVGTKERKKFICALIEITETNLK